MEAKTLARLSDCSKLLVKQLAALAKHGAVSGNPGATPNRRANASESANLCAIEIRRLKHEAHCLAVELGIADRRDDSHYTPTTAALGFGRFMLLDRREPKSAEVAA